MGAGIVSIDLLNSQAPVLDGGTYVTLTNKTGALSVKGTVLAISNTFDNAVRLNTTNKPDQMAIMYDNGIADGSPVRVIVRGIAQVLVKDGGAVTHGDFAATSSVAGRIQPQSNVGNIDNSVGFCLESHAAGTNILVKVLLNLR